MYEYQNSEDRSSVLQMNSDLGHAQMELVSATCAVQQLRLQYSTDDLARFGSRDILRKSVQAVTVLHEFYTSIQSRIQAGNSKCIPPSADQITEAVGWISTYLREQRDYYSPIATPLSGLCKDRMDPYFASEFLDRIRIVELRGARVRVPDFFAKVRALGFDPPEVAHMDSLTFLDVVAFNQVASERALFHALVHAVQIDILGLQRYSELWVRGFIKTRTHFTVPLEVHAFTLSSKFVRPATETFSVENEIQRWVTDDRY